MVHDTNAPPTYAPLAAQRRRLRDRALTILYDRHGGRAVAALPDAARPTPPIGAARSAWERLAGLVRHALGGPGTRGRRPPPPPAPVAASVATSSAATAAALAQRLTGPGSGPYSGTPFRPATGAAETARPATADAAPSEAARHDHGIIDHSRHVSSIGRR